MRGSKGRGLQATNVFDVFYHAVSSSFAGHRLRCHHTQCVIHEVVIGIAVILRRRSSQRVVSSASPSSFEEGHHNVLCHRLRRHPSKKVITCGVVCTDVESLEQFQQPSPNILTKAGLSLGRSQQKELAFRVCCCRLLSQKDQCLLLFLE